VSVLGSLIDNALDTRHQRRLDRGTNSKPRPTTTDAGIPVASDELSLTVGPDVPIGSVFHGAPAANGELTTTTHAEHSQ
jgi:hypothetical protein